MNKHKILHFEVQNLFHKKNSWMDLTLALKVVPLNPNFYLKYTSETNTISRLVWSLVVKANQTFLTHYLKLSLISNNYRIPYPIHLLNDFLTVFLRDSSPAAQLFCFEALQPKDKFTRIIAVIDNLIWISPCESCTGDTNLSMHLSSSDVRFANELFYLTGSS